MSQRQRESVPAQLLVPVEVIERRIFLIRGQKVMLDSDSAPIAAIYDLVKRSMAPERRRRRPIGFIVSPEGR